MAVEKGGRRDPVAAPARTDRGSANGGKAELVQAMFTRIASRYDLMNALMTFGRHQAWRRVAARATIAAPEGPVLDLATGTADLALAILEASRHRRVVGADFSVGMLRQAQRKLRARRATHISLVAADALRLPFADACFACVISAFLLRNLADLGQGLREMRRVTRPGGRVVMLEITRPTLPVFSQVFGVYFHRLVPAVGAVIAGDAEAYRYLPDSVERFASPAELIALMKQAGLRSPSYRLLGLGTIAIHTGVV
jgi:demethylmenaquinone methyltransferase/2-methoxy-6-polyprenyl-1,4-benzoquinol methylase